MKTLSSLLVCFSYLAFIASCQNYIRGDNLHSEYPSDQYDSDRLRKFKTACPAECVCSLQERGLEVDCSGKDLTEIPKNLSPLTECLDLSINNISKIARESFAALKQLTVLYLSLNNISVITTEAFAPLRELKELWLSGNFIRELPQGIFTGFRNMEYLHLEDNNLESIPPNAVSKMPNLKELNLAANYISSISSNALAKLGSLEHLWLDDNDLTEIPSRALGKVPSIKALALDMNRLTTIRNGDLDQLVNLEVLLLKHNEIIGIENNVFEMLGNIQIIDLSYNNLTSPPPAVKDALRLKTLKLANNKIQVLPDLAFAGNLELSELTLTGNPIKSAGKTAFIGLRNLVELSLEEAEDMKVFPDLSGCKKLKSLTITGGKLKSIPSNLCSNVPNLEALTLSGNRLKNLTGLLRCSNLTQLDVSDNELEQVTTNETRNMTKMRHLNLASNRIHHLDADAFSRMNHIESLNLAYNYFTFLPMRGLGSLTHLNISGVRTMLYLPPIALFHNLRSLAAYYPYHCCLVAKIPRKVDDSSYLNAMHLSPMYPSNEDTPLMSSPVQCSSSSGLMMTPCDDLLPSMPIRVFWWIAMIASFILNGIILLSCTLRYCLKRHREIPSDEQMLRRVESDSPYTDARMVVHDFELNPSHYCLNISRRNSATRGESDTFDLSLCHVALADFIVSGYTAVILTYDRMTRGHFAEDGAWWQQSPFCHSAGFLLTFGTQLAFTTVAVMAVERYLATMYPLKTERHIRKNVLAMALSSAWVISLVTATATLFGGAGNETADKMLGMLTPKSGATCLPWNTEFGYIAALAGFHVIVCLVMCTLCFLMYCGKRKQSWLSARKCTRRQVSLVVASNVIFIAPLVVLAACVSGYITFSGLVAGPGGEYTSPEDGSTVLDLGRLLAFAMFVIPFRPFLNPVLYLSFNKPLRRDLAYVTKKIIFGDSFPRRPPFSQHRNSVLEAMTDSVSDIQLRTDARYPALSTIVYDSGFTHQTVAYDNRGVISSSSAHVPSLSLAPSTSRTVGSRRASSERRRRKRYTRSRRGDRRTTDTDPTTESEVITFHRGGESVHYHPDRRRKLSIRYGGVNAKDEFQRLIFPRVPNLSSSDHGSDSTVYPVIPATRSAITSSSYNRHVRTESPKNLSCDADASDVSSTYYMPGKAPSQQDRYDLPALRTYRADNSATSFTAPLSSKLLHETASQPAGMSYDTDMEVAGINSTNSPDFEEENPFFDDRDTAKRLYKEEGSRKTTHQRPRSQAGENRPSTSQEANNASPINGRFNQSPAMRKDRTASQSSGNSAVHLINRMGKIGNSCEYCDSSASKDSGIHSEIDSASGASYSDTSIGRRLHFSASGDGLKTCDIISTIGERDISSFAIIPTINGAAQVRISPLSNDETTI